MMLSGYGLALTSHMAHAEDLFNVQAGISGGSTAEKDFKKTVNDVVGWFMIVMYVLCGLTFAWAAFRYMTSDHPEKMKQLLTVGGGAVIVAASFTIIRLIFSLFQKGVQVF